MELRQVRCQVQCHRIKHPKIKGPDNPTRQLLPIMSTTCCSGDRERRKDKVACDKVVYERWSVTKKDGVCDKVVCERWCV